MNENYEDYEDEKELKTEEEEDYEEEKDEEKESRRKKILLLILIIIGIIIIILLLTRCGRGNKEKEFDIEKTLLEAGKEYYEYNENEIPKAKSSCTNVSLTTLIADGLLDPDKYATCDGEETYVKVCLLSNGKVHYVPILKCDSFNSDDEYEAWEEGTLDDIKPDETDVKFAYMGQVLKDDANITYGETKELWYGEEEIPYKTYRTLSKTTYYRSRDLQYRWLDEIRLYYPNDTTTPSNVYYPSSPADGYTNKDNEQTGYKWYKLLSGGDKVYCDGYHYAAPEGCPIADTTQGYKVASRIRTFENNGTLSSFDALKMYQCAESKYESQILAGNLSGIVFSNEYYACGDSRNTHPEHNYEYKTFYSCDGAVTRVAQGTKCYKCGSGELRPDNSACGTYTAWKLSGDACNGLADVCTNITPVNYYKWYRESGIKSYYPSGSATAAGEKAYYVTSPGSEYIKDDSTGAKLWSWYKKTGSITEEYYTTAPNSSSTRSEYSRWTDWTDWTTNVISSLGNAGTRNIQTKIKLKVQEIKNVDKSGYENIMSDYTFDVNELIQAFKDKGYDINTLEDIALNGELKYLVKIYVRNK